MKPSTNRCLAHQKLTSTNSSDIQTATVPNGCSAIEMAVETTSCRMTLDGTDPSTGVGLIVQKDQMPWFMPVGQGCTFKFVSTSGLASVIQLAYLS